jgi:uncharacterized protein YkwD
MMMILMTMMMKMRGNKNFLFFLFCLLCCSNLTAILPQRKAHQASLHQQMIHLEEEINKKEVVLVELINAQRSKYHLRPLVLSGLLTTIAKIHSSNMAKGVVAFGHAGFEERVSEIRHCGHHQAFGENVGYFFHVQDTLEAAVNGWMKSRHHRENILGDFDDTGIGIAYDAQGKCFITQLFAKRKPR